MVLLGFFFSFFFGVYVRLKAKMKHIIDRKKSLELILQGKWFRQLVVVECFTTKYEFDVWSLVIVNSN